ncbi:MAG: hypothetical protein AAF216_11845, partial [Pseudomonadota bacterium]
MRGMTAIGVLVAVAGGGVAGAAAYFGDDPANPGSVSLACVSAMGLALTVWSALRPVPDISGVEDRLDTLDETAREGQRKDRAERAKDRIALKAGLEGVETSIGQIGDDVAAKITAALEARGAGPATIETALQNMAEVLASNDPDKDAARAAIRAGDVDAAEAALAAIYEKERAAIALMADKVDQARQEAARTAMEKASLAATRSAAEALDWYQKAAETAPDHFSAHIMVS